MPTSVGPIPLRHEDLGYATSAWTIASDAVWPCGAGYAKKAVIGTEPKIVSSNEIFTVWFVLFCAGVEY
jgi:uncharacterized membrane protein YccF (DUF307 family)